MARIELKNCPFCGGKANYCDEDGEDDCYHECHLIECKNCGLFDCNDKNNREELSELRNDAAEIWNSRKEAT